MFQEQLKSEPFWLMVACIMVNQARWATAEPILAKLRSDFASPSALSKIEQRELARRLNPLGFQKVRANRIRELAAFWSGRKATHVYSADQVGNIPGIGGFGADSYRIFVLGEKGIRSKDKRIQTHLSSIDNDHPTAQDLFQWMEERHAIYERRAAGQPWPWTEDKIMQEFKFTNVFRELDRTTKWMRRHITRPNDKKGNGPLMVFNCGMFRYVGTIRAGEILGWVEEFQWNKLAAKLEAARSNGDKVWTAAYIITNVGRGANSSHPKSEVIFGSFLRPLWNAREAIHEVARKTKSLQATHEALGEIPGFGGGFMAYELVSDLRNTSVLRDAKDVMTWANPGPGCRKGLNWIHGRQRNDKPPREQLVGEMRELLELAGKECRLQHLEMREIEHSLCEFDKYTRTRLGMGRPRSTYRKPSEK